MAGLLKKNLPQNDKDPGSLVKLLGDEFRREKASKNYSNHPGSVKHSHGLLEKKILFLQKHTSMVCLIGTFWDRTKPVQWIPDLAGSNQAHLATQICHAYGRFNIHLPLHLAASIEDVVSLVRRDHV